ncbi:MAG: alpha/beta hydrolase [Dehalococcoidia bacterium]|nr:alpha/beta hydrolase [Dehalococcoidia bacterium]MDP7469761.1 alpha/beta hydrolase [Dehalococcoidia bacterium]
MPKAKVNGVDLHYEVAGEGFPLVLSHEFGGDGRSWDTQVKYFSRYYQVVTYNHRGFPPSETPEDPAAYSQEVLVEDLHQLLHHLGINQAYVGGLSLGGNVALNYGIAHPEVVKALVVAATGSGSMDREQFEVDLEHLARLFETEGVGAVAELQSKSPTRVQLLRKDPKGWQVFRENFKSHSAIGSTHILRGVILKRPNIFALEYKLRQLRVPALIMVGDEDDPCVEPAVFMKRNIPCSGLVVFPQSGHAINLEEPDLFNRAVRDFLTLMEARRWAVRQPQHGRASVFFPGETKG